MSRTVKNRKGPGYEYWGRRPMPMGSPGKWTKRMTHKLERRERKRLEYKAAVGEEPVPYWPKTA